MELTSKKPLTHFTAPESFQKGYLILKGLYRGDVHYTSIELERTRPGHERVLAIHVSYASIELELNIL
ncbi:MAG TPA: hypothetical protein GX509_04750 [Firmicutes bacterium]|nr:hypothetical protein [Bacillota bacterium]